MAAKFSIDPRIVIGVPVTARGWPAWLQSRVRFWMSAKNQGESDRAENEAAEREAGINR